MNNLESSNDFYPRQKSYPQVESLFTSLNISEQDKEKIQSEFSCIAKIVYENNENTEGISCDTVMKIKLGETNPDSFVIQNDEEGSIVGKYLDFIQSYPHGEKIWRMLTAYYNPNLG